MRYTRYGYTLVIIQPIVDWFVGIYLDGEIWYYLSRSILLSIFLSQPNIAGLVVEISLIHRDSSNLR